MRGLGRGCSKLCISIPKPAALRRETQCRLTLGSTAADPEAGLYRAGPAGSPHPARRADKQYQYDALRRMSFRAQQGDQAHHYAVDAAGNPLAGLQPVTRSLSTTALATVLMAQAT